MPEDFLKDSMTKTHGIRSGEPKRPESLIEMPSMIPEVPEVSLCFNLEKNQPLQSNRTSTFEVAGSVVNQRHHGNEILHRNKYESYNTWKAKNAQALHNIAGGLEGTELGSKRASSTKRSAGLVRKQNSGNGTYSPQIIAPKYPVNGAFELVGSTQQIDSNAKCNPRINAQLKVPTSNQPGPTYAVEHHHTGHPVHNHHFPQHYIRDSKQTEENLKNPSSPSSNLQNHHSCKDRIDENIPYTYQMSDQSNYNGNPVFCVPNYCNKLQCSCEKQNERINSLNGHQFVNEKTMLTDESRAKIRFFDSSKLYSPSECGLINNHLSSLSHVLNVQKEQISMLFQEMSSQKMIMSALLEEVKQIHAAVSSNTQINRDTPPTEKKSCRCCSCEQKNDQSLRNKTSEDSMNDQINHNGNNSTSKQPPLSLNSVEKRSVGVMTSSFDKYVNSTESCIEKEKSQRVNNNVDKVKKHHQKPKAANSPSPNKNKQKKKKEHTQIEEKRKPQSNHTQRRNNKQEESNESEDSFSLDETAVVVRTETEHADASPEVSIHVNMPDYSASSAESDTADSSGSEDEGQESGTEGESSDPHIGWTFYDRVVGQVNNMLKKTSNDPRQDYAQAHRKNAGNVLYQCNEDYETENNWSKRVTFDGPPLEDSDNNGFQVPRYHHFRGNQDYRLPGGPERLQDFLVRDYANGGNNLSLVNGSTNMSFATYRYYQRHQLLPPPPPPDQMFLDPPHTKKKNKTKKSEKTLPVSQKSHKRRSGGPPSKILDMSHQPKLF